MKKALVILLAIFMVGAAFAEDVVTPSVSGSASVTWGYDLQTEGSGFSNANDVVVTFPMASKGSQTKGGDGMYGEITVSNFGFKLQQTGETPVFVDIDGDNGFAVSAKIWLAPEVFNVGIYSKPSTEVKYAEIVGAAGSDLTVANASSNGGISLNYLSDMVKLSGLVVSKSGSEDSTDNEYAAKGWLRVKPVDMFELEGAYVFNKNLAAANAEHDAGVKAVLNVAPVKLTLGSDMNIAPAFAYDFRADLDVTIVEKAAILGAKYWTNQFEVMNASVELTGEAGIATYGVKAGLDDLTGTLAWNVAARLGLTLAEDLKFAANFGYKSDETYDLVYNSDYSAISLTMGPKFHSIDNTTFTLKYADLAGASSGVSDKGEITIAAKVSF